MAFERIRGIIIARGFGCELLLTFGFIKAGMELYNRD